MGRRGFAATSATPWVKVEPGLEMRPLVEGGGTALVLYRLEPGVTFRPHRHPNPEYGTLILGRGRLLLEGTNRVLEEGDSYYVPRDVEHGFDSPPQPGPVVLLHVVVGEGSELRPEIFRRVVDRTRQVVGPVPA